MAVQNAQELFLYKLAEMYDVEQKLTQVLPVLIKEVDNQAAREVLSEHEQETRQHARNIEQCFQILGTQPMAVECQAVKGLKMDHDMFVQQQPSPTILTKFDLKAACDSETMEIAKYSGLIDDALNLGFLQVVPILHENKLQEEVVDKKVAKISHELTKQLVKR
ncbi:MAG TPA: DUF892 family protein [Ktedonobacteraceae bacterium]|nr:DUF892 family protein [Ktedonobacteraceae bacterium]